MPEPATAGIGQGQALLQPCSDPSELLLTAAQLASPLPDEDSAWRKTFDRMGAPRPRPVSHSQIQETIRDLGGYDTLWHQYPFVHTPLGVLRSQFLEAYRRSRARWETAVRETLLRPSHAWDWSVLPPDNPLLHSRRPNCPQAKQEPSAVRSNVRLIVSASARRTTRLRVA